MLLRYIVTPEYRDISSTPEISQIRGDRLQQQQYAALSSTKCVCALHYSSITRWIQGALSRVGVCQSSCLLTQSAFHGNGVFRLFRQKNGKCKRSLNHGPVT